MKSYILLRDNLESGPYTLQEMKTVGLRSQDLIWIEGESTSWKYPSEIEELKSSVKAARKKKADAPQSFTATTKKSAQTLKQSSTEPAASFPAASMASLHEEAYPPSFEELKRRHEVYTPRKSWKRQLNIASNLFGLTILAIGTLMSYYVVRNAIQYFGYEPLVATADARQIGSETTAKHSASHQAQVPAAEIQNSAPAPDTALLKTLLSTAESKTNPAAVASESTLAYKDTPATLGMAPAHQDTHTTSTTRVDPLAPLTASEETEETQPSEEPKQEKALQKASSGKPALQIVANDYKVGLLGGISNLRLSLINPSSQMVDKALVEVEFLKPNGKVIESQTYEVNDISPGASKKIDVPDNSRGVKVRYRIVTIEAHPAKIAANDI